MITSIQEEPVCYKLYLIKILRESDNRKSIRPTLQYQHSDPDLIYDRPPHIVKFKVSNYSISLSEFSLVNVHLRPTAVVNESLELKNVVNLYKQASLLDNF